MSKRLRDHPWGSCQMLVTEQAPSWAVGASSVIESRTDSPGKRLTGQTGVQLRCPRFPGGSDP